MWCKWCRVAAVHALGGARGAQVLGYVSVGSSSCSCRSSRWVGGACAFAVVRRRGVSECLGVSPFSVGALRRVLMELTEKQTTTGGPTPAFALSSRCDRTAIALPARLFGAIPLVDRAPGPSLGASRTFRIISGVDFEHILKIQTPENEDGYTC